MKIRKIFKSFPLILILAVLVSVFVECKPKSNTHKNVYPGADWQNELPEKLGVNPVVLDSAISYFKAHSGGVGTDEMVIIKNGYIIWEGPNIDNKHELFSCTKIFTSTVMGVLAAEGKLRVDDLAVKYFPDLCHGIEGQEVYNQIRFRDLATMTAGYQGIVSDCWGLHLKGLHNESYECTQKYTIPGKPQYIPRTKISYRDPNVHMLGYILTKIAGKSLENVFKESVADKIGMVNWDWSDYGYRDGLLFNNPAGTPNNLEASEMNDVQAGIWTTAREFARLGILYLNKGVWNDEQVLDSVFAEMAISNQVPVELPAIGVDLAGRYGFYWWTNGIKKDGTRPWPFAPPKTSTPHGGGRNFCFVIPEWDMVIVRISPRWESAIPNPGEQIWAEFFKILNEAITKAN